MKQLQLLKLYERGDGHMPLITYVVVEDGRKLARMTSYEDYVACDVSATGRIGRCYLADETPGTPKRGTYARASLDFSWIHNGNKSSTLFLAFLHLLQALHEDRVGELEQRDLRLIERNAELLPPDVRVKLGYPIEDKSLERAIQKSLDHKNHFTTQHA